MQFFPSNRCPSLNWSTRMQSVKSNYTEQCRKKTISTFKFFIEISYQKETFLKSTNEIRNTKPFSMSAYVCASLSLYLYFLLIILFFLRTLLLFATHVDYLFCCSCSHIFPTHIVHSMCISISCSSISSIFVSSQKLIENVLMMSKCLSGVRACVHALVRTWRHTIEMYLF